MENKILVICDSEPTYAELLTKQLLRLDEGTLEIRKFSDMSKLKEFAVDKLITYLLISEEYKGDLEEVEALSYYFLTNSKGEVENDFLDSEYLYRYQAVKDIYEKIVGYKHYNQEMKSKEILNQRTEIIGMYNPVRRSGQTTFARAMAAELGRKKLKVLYINLDEIGVSVDKLRDFEKDVEGKGNISDIIYYLKQKSEQLPELIKRATHQGRRYDFIAPPAIFTELQSVTQQEWILLMDYLKNADYQRIILDLDSKIQGYLEILDKCDRVLVPSVQGDECDEKKDSFNKGLRVLGKNKLLIKMEPVTVPKFVKEIDMQVVNFLKHEKLLN